MEKIFLGIGTNIGDREANLKQALIKIEENIGPVVSSSSVYETEPWGFMSENNFLNLVVEVETDLNPSGLLGRVMMIESILGRVREGKGYKPRLIDIDILFYGQRIIRRKVLTVPHPKLHERKFVLVPLCEVDGDLVHPVFRKNIRSLLEECPDRGRVEKKVEEEKG